MFSLLRKITIIFAALMIVYLGYEAFYRDTSKEWKHFKKPELASFTSLEQDGAILTELDRQTQFNTYKPLDPVFFVKPSIFQKIEP
ncbi:hypothetical protein JXA05_04635 [Candidatus Peregrinibacteria bacterium]|nr:hypothetical protein [Candidatus Peregrinibacteria bacterium]